LINVFLQETSYTEKKVEILYSSRGYFNAQQVIIRFFRMDVLSANFILNNIKSYMNISGALII
jgi:hypothetical protein